MDPAHQPPPHGVLRPSAGPATDASDRITRKPRVRDHPAQGAVNVPDPAAVSSLLVDLREGRRAALDALFPLVYEELRELAHRQRAAWNGQHTLNTTALVHEAYLKLVDRGHASWETEAHFLATAACAIRHILINHARDRRALKRGGNWQRVPWNDEEAASSAAGTERTWEDGVLALEDALQRLAVQSERQSRIVECRFFGGMTVQQTALALGLSTATVTRGWAVARAWLYRDLRGALTFERSA